MIVNDESTKDLLFEFILQRKPTLVAVIYFEMVNTATEENSHKMDYKVKCIVEEEFYRPIDPPFSSRTTKVRNRVEAVCIVNSLTFKTWVDNKTAIRWL